LGGEEGYPVPLSSRSAGGTDGTGDFGGGDGGSGNEGEAIDGFSRGVGKGSSTEHPAQRAVHSVSGKRILTRVHRSVMSF